MWPDEAKTNGKTSPVSSLALYGSKDSRLTPDLKKVGKPRRVGSRQPRQKLVDTMLETG